MNYHFVTTVRNVFTKTTRPIVGFICFIGVPIKQIIIFSTVEIRTQTTQQYLYSVVFQQNIHNNVNLYESTKKKYVNAACARHMLIYISGSTS